MRFPRWYGRASSGFLFWVTVALASLWSPLLAYSEYSLEDEREDQNPPESFSKGFKALWDDSIYLLTSPTRMTSRDALVVGGVVAGIGGVIAADHGIRYTVQKNTTIIQQ